MKSDSQHAFEGWARENGSIMDWNPHTGFDSHFTHWLWKAWQAGIEHKEKENEKTSND